eukprot:CAMPEP_0176500222 /NCGR_PEP_ID=MMETSP0200_2-20121128/13399_1 /TAXON_ID=947934 /ORGANISM="Chaetoceros sp., Strain GSL56" /LENGTH=364 /DNA_ID=CAMNT_0017898801 /DNA_START=715 /DNA_END=1809 /DNA_ORIENTATION=+
MNFAALLSGPVVDYCTILYKNGHVGDEERFLQEEAEQVYSERSWSLTGYRLIVLLGILSNIIACVVAQSMKEIKVCADEQPEMGDCENDSSLENVSFKVQTFQPENASMYDIIKETVSSAAFWRFLVVIMVTLNVRMIFRHLDATLPKYMIREFGANVPKGTIYSINPLMIMILVPIISAATTKIDPLVMIHHGCYISAASVFFLVISTSIPACVLFVVFLSIGEAIWSPRLYDYTCSIAKEGREGTYMALSSAPLFLAKLPVGMMSGYLLHKYCPEEGERNSKIMWLIIGLSTASSPILLTLCWGYISKRENSSQADERMNDLLSQVPQHELSRLQQVMVPVVNSQIELSDIKKRPSNSSVLT